MNVYDIYIVSDISEPQPPAILVMPEGLVPNARENSAVISLYETVDAEDLDRVELLLRAAWGKNLGPRKDTATDGGDVSTYRTCAGEKTPPEVSSHGPCDEYEEDAMSVRQVVEGSQKILEVLAPESKWLNFLTFTQKRLDFGEKKYGTVLRVGWPKAQEAMLEELSDLLAYGVAAGDTIDHVRFNGLVEDILRLLDDPRV